MARRWIVAVAALAAMALTLGTAQAGVANRNDSLKYTGVIGDAYVVGCDASDPDLGGLGGVCFTLNAEDTRIVSLGIVDDSGLPVGGLVRYTDQLGDAGTNLGERSICGSTGSFARPAGANYILVFIDGPVFGPLDCLGTAAGVGTQGHVDVTIEYTTTP